MKFSHLPSAPAACSLRAVSTPAAHGEGCPRRKHDIADAREGDCSLRAERQRAGASADARSHGDTTADPTAEGRSSRSSWPTPLSGRYGSFHSNVIGATAGEAPFVLDGLVGNAAEFDPLVHHVDTGGVSDHVFALFHLLGLSFAPRLRDFPDRRLACVGRPGRWREFAPIMGRADQRGRGTGALERRPEADGRYGQSRGPPAATEPAAGPELAQACLAAGLGPHRPDGRLRLELRRRRAHQRASPQPLSGEDSRPAPGRTCFLTGRVAAGSCPPAAPADPGVPDSGTRLLEQWSRCSTVHTVHDPHLR